MAGCGGQLDFTLHDVRPCSSLTNEYCEYYPSCHDKTFGPLDHGSYVEELVQ